MILRAPTITAYPEHAAAITPDDDDDLARPMTVVATGPGDLKVDTAGGETVTVSGWPAAVPLPVQVRRVYATGTTATGILGIW